MSESTEELILTDTDYRTAAGRLFDFKKSEGFVPVGLHLYRQSDGSILYGRVRMHKLGTSGGHEKFVRPFWNDGTGWKHGEPKQDGGKLLYGLHELSANPNVPVLVTEGEQKADALTRIGAGRFVAVTSGGATSADGANWLPLARRDVILWADHDAPGAKYAADVAAKLVPLGCSVARIDVAVLGLPAAGDVMDWIVALGRQPSADEVLALPKIVAELENAGTSVATQIASDAPADEAVPAKSDDDAIAWLAALPPMQYDRVRKDEAGRLNVRPATLDQMVKAARGEIEIDNAAPFQDVEPWHEPVDGGALLSEMAHTIRRFIVCDSETVTAAVLWCVAAWLVDHVSVCPILLINAPEKACGKTQFLTVVGRMVPRPAQAASISQSVLFRMVEKYQPTLLVDEIETVLTKDAEDLRGLMNAGHTRDSAFVWRSVAVGDDFEPKRFNVFGFKALAGINADRLAETITSRAVVAQMRRKLPHETAERLRHAESGLFDALRAKLARWTEDYAEAVRASRPEFPDALSDRDQDNWEPLFAVADLAGGNWPEVARRAALKLCSNGAVAQSSGAELLADIRDVFETRKMRRISSVDLLGYLSDDEEKPWATWSRGKPMTPRQLSEKLSKYGITSANIKFGNADVRKGYRAEQFDEAFSRYLSAAPDSSATSLPSNAGVYLPVADTESGSATEHASATAKSLLVKAGGEVAAKTGDSPENEKSVTDDDGEGV